MKGDNLIGGLFNSIVVALIGICIHISPIIILGQVPIEIEGDSRVGQPHFQITEIGQDFTRMTFKNTANPNKFWTIAAEPHDTGIPRINFFYNNGSGGADRFTVTGIGRVGINTTNPASNLHVVGNVRVSDLAGYGKKPVYVQDNGTLVTSTAIKYYSIPASAFRPGGDTPGIAWVSNAANAYFVDSSGRELVAPVQLPHGSTIKKITVVYEDLDPNYSAHFKLAYFDSAYETTIPFNLIGYKSSAVTIVSEGGSGYNTTEADNVNVIIDNLTRSYSFRMVRHFGVTGRPLDDEFKIIQVIFEYID